jgi:hypothetical protein
MVERRRWKCPNCGRTWDIPIGHNPQSCPKCMSREAQSPASTDPERQLQDFYTRPRSEPASSAWSPQTPTEPHQNQQPPRPEPFFIGLPHESPAGTSAPTQGRSTGLFVLTYGVLISGLCTVLYYWLIFDTTVAPYGLDGTQWAYSLRRVHNVGLMQDRMLGLLVGLGIFAIGITLTIVRAAKRW